MPKAKSNRTAWIIIGAIPICAILLCVVGVFWFKSMLDSGDDWKRVGKELGQRMTDVECVEHALVEDEACWGMTCRVRTPVVLAVCLEHAAPTQGFCEGVPSTERVGASVAWRLRSISSRSLSFSSPAAASVNVTATIPSS